MASVMHQEFLCRAHQFRAFEYFEHRKSILGCRLAGWHAGPWLTKNRRQHSPVQDDLDFLPGDEPRRSGFVVVVEKS
jgi:hypothetical protein